jgi:hypothetical protein
MASSASLDELDDLLGKLEPEQPFPADVIGKPRGRTTSPRPVSLPYGWLADRHLRAIPHDAEMADSGG